MKQLEVKLAIPAVKDEGFREAKIPKSKVIESFVENYLESYQKNREIIKKREIDVRKISDLSKITFTILIFYLLLLGFCLMFFVN